MMVSTPKFPIVTLFFFSPSILPKWENFYEEECFTFALKLAKSGLVLPWGKEWDGQSYMWKHCKYLYLWVKYGLCEEKFYSLFGFREFCSLP